MSGGYTPGMVSYAPPPEPETHMQRLARLRPADRSAVATRTALAAIAAEHQAAETRLDQLQQARTRKLLTAAPSEIAAARDAVETCEIEIEQFSALTEALTAALRHREAEEAEAGKMLAELADAAARACKAATKFLTTDYEKHARAIVAGVELEQTALNALARLQHERASWPGVAVPFVSLVLPNWHYPPAVPRSAYA
jgi:hypothetical protein